MMTGSMALGAGGVVRTPRLPSAEADTLAGVEAEPDGRSLTARARRRLTRHAIAALAFSVVVNLLFLVAPLYMLQVYDRVLTSGSIETLLYLSVISVFLLGVWIFADAGRKRVMVRAGQLLGESLDGITLRRGLAKAATPAAETTTAIQNLGRVQSLLLHGTVSPIFDVMFVPLFIVVLFALHWLLGVIALIGALMLVGMAVGTDRVSRRSVREAGQRDQRAQAHLAHTIRQRTAIVSMGMTDRAIRQWQRLRRSSIDLTVDGGEMPTFLTSATRSFRQILQIGILGVGAALAVAGSITPGTVVAGSIILGRALAPIDQTVLIWRQLILGAKSWSDLCVWLDQVPTDDASVPSNGRIAALATAARPAPQLRFDEFAVGIPGSDLPLLPKMTCELPRGALIALLGTSGSGKTSLLQSVAGAWSPQHGSVHLGGRDMRTWAPHDRGRSVGYLPQHTELLTGTVYENIARFTDCAPDEVFEAAERVGCHDMILSLPQGYDTPIGEGGAHLSGGQRQAIGLARAFFGQPSLILLDEPTAHLDAGLAASLMSRFAHYTRQPAEDRDITAIVATHDLRLINAADLVMLVRDRKVTITPREDYLKRVSDLSRQKQTATDENVSQASSARLAAEGPVGAMSDFPRDVS